MSTTPEATQDAADGFLPGDTEAGCSSRQARDQERRKHPQERCGSPSPTPGSRLPRSELTQTHQSRILLAHYSQSPPAAMQEAEAQWTASDSVSNGRPRMLLIPTALHWRLQSPPATELWLLDPSFSLSSIDIKSPSQGLCLPNALGTAT